MYEKVDKPEIAPGVKFWKNKGNNFHVLMIHYSSDPEKDPNRDGAEWFKNEQAGTPKADWLKEREIDFTTRAGKQIFGPEFCDFNQNIHYIPSFHVDDTYELMIGLDFGQRAPTAALIGAWSRDNRLYIIDEYYKPALPSTSSREMFEQFSYLMGNPVASTPRLKREATSNAFQVRVIDPTTRAKNRTKRYGIEEIEYSVIEEFYDHGWDFAPGVNDVSASITRVREYFQVDEYGKSHLYIFRDKCPNLCWELERYRYKELSEQQEQNRNAPEEPVKRNDHAVDSLRYLIMSRPYSPKVIPKPKTKTEKDFINMLRPRDFSQSFDVD